MQKGKIVYDGNLQWGYNPVWTIEEGLTEV